jgi:adenine phosphoribosyltransferase
MDGKKFIVDYPDFPKEGILFRDISPLLANSDSFRLVVDSMEIMVKFRFSEADIIVGMDARGFIFGSVVAYSTGLGLVMVRKAGKLPGETVKKAYSFEYSEDYIEVQKEAVAGKKIVIIDDLLATGGTLNAVASAIREAGGEVLGAVTAIELTDLKGRANIDFEVVSLIQY